MLSSKVTIAGPCNDHQAKLHKATKGTKVLTITHNVRPFNGTRYFAKTGSHSRAVRGALKPISSFKDFSPKDRRPT